MDENESNTGYVSGRMPADRDGASELLKEEEETKPPQRHHNLKEEVAQFAATWNPSRIFDVLSDVGLLEMGFDETQRCLADPEDDEVAQEIRALQSELHTIIRQTNDTKRTLRRRLDKCVRSCYRGRWRWWLTVVAWSGRSHGCPKKTRRIRRPSANTPQRCGGER